MLVHHAYSPLFPKLSAGESSPTSPDNFRQLDDVFLQTQTRIWLGEVLRTRLNEERSIADLLADGELLFEVSKEVWKMMLSKHSELKTYEYELLAPRNSGRYMPYSFVDSFLKMCKILGLDGIDLFSPSDVVEKGDTRKVCVCLRALSKKARSLDLNVPDFDIVTNTIAMTTDMVGYIRRSWELSLSEYSNSSSLAQYQKLRQSQRSSQENLNEVCERNYSSVKEFGDSETNSMLQSDSSTTNCSYNSSSYFSSNSVKAKNDCLDFCSANLGVETQEEDESSHCHQEEVCSSKLEGSLFLHQLNNDNQEKNVASLSAVDSNSQSGGSFLNLESGSGNSYRSNLVGQIYHNLNLEDEASVVEGSLQCCTPKSNITDDQQAVSAIMGDGNSTGDDKNSIFNAGVGTGSCCSKMTSDENEYTSRYLDGDDVEVFSVGSVNSMSIYVRNLDFDDDLEIEKSFPETTNVKLEGMSMKVIEGSKSQDVIERSALEKILSTNKKEESLKLKGVNIGLSLPACFIAHSGKYTSGYIDPVMPYDKNISKPHTNLNSGDEGKELFAAESFFSQWDQKGKCQIAVVPTGNVGCDALSQSPSLPDHSYQYIQGEVIGDALQHDKINSIVADNDKEYNTMIIKSHPDACKQTNGCNIVGNGNMDKKGEQIQKLQISAVEQTNDGTMRIAKSKPQKRPLLKAVVSGTAAVGATLLLLHLRKNGREKSGELGEKSNGVGSRNGRDLSAAKEQKARKADGVYPAGKLKL